MKKEKPTWESDALVLLDKAPLFIRKIAKNKVEKAAIAEGIGTITEAFVQKIRKSAG